MIPEKIDSNSIITLREKGVESIVDWFEQHKQSFYALGRSYLSNPQQIEELFYKTIIKVQKELPRFKGKSSFETWVTSIFIHTCKDLSDNRSLQALEEREQQKDLFNALNKLKESEKEALVLTYIKGLSHEETASLLQVSADKMKDLLFTGIQSLRNDMGYGSFNGCKEYQKNYIDYLERNLERSIKIDLEKHIYHCQACQEDLASLQDIMLTMLNLTNRIKGFHVPSDLMKNIKVRLAEKEAHRQQKNKKRIRVGLVMVGLFALLIGLEFLTGMFSKPYYALTEKDQELRTFLQQDLGERLDLEAESDGVKIKIKGAIADDVQTLVFYEIEDSGKDNQYAIDFFDGVFVENEQEIMNAMGYRGYYPPDLQSEINKEEKNVYHGKISLLPLTEDKGTIKLKISRLHKLIRDSAGQNGIGAIENMAFESGEWNFEIPVTKQPSVEYALDEETELEGIPVRFDKLTVAPTATVLHYGINIEKPEKRVDVLNFKSLVVNDNKLIPDFNGGSFPDTHLEANWMNYQRNFEPILGENPKEVSIQFESIYLTFEAPKTVVLDESQEYPQTFEYAGSTITLDKVEVGTQSKVVIINHKIENRAYETLQLQIVGENESEPIAMDWNSEGVLVDKHGNQYDSKEMPVAYEEIEQPRYFSTVETIGLRSDNNGEKVMPIRLDIYGYNTTKYLDDVVKISLDSQ